MNLVIWFGGIVLAAFVGWLIRAVLIGFWRFCGQAKPYSSAAFCPQCGEKLK
jgi:hypothetical protein